MKFRKYKTKSKEDAKIWRKIQIEKTNGKEKKKDKSDKKEFKMKIKWKKIKNNFKRNVIKEFKIGSFKCEGK